MPAERFQCFTQSAEPVRATVVVRRAWMKRRQDAGLGEVVRMHELVNIVSTAKNRHVISFVHPFEKDLKNAEPAMAHDRAGTNDGGIQAPAEKLAAQILTLQLRAPIRLH